MCWADIRRRNCPLYDKWERWFVAILFTSLLNLNFILGVLTQLGIVLGIMATQVAGFWFAAPSQWRLVLFLSSVIGSVQFLAGYLAVETPTYLRIKGRQDEMESVSGRLWDKRVTQHGKST